MAQPDSYMSSRDRKLVQFQGAIFTYWPEDKIMEKRKACQRWSMRIGCKWKSTHKNSYVLGIPWDVETDELKYHMRKFGEIEDCIVMKDRVTGQSRGFGYVTFISAEDARKATAAEHVLNDRKLEVKIATPREEMRPSASRKINRIFVARIPPSVTDDVFRSYFQKYGAIIDAYMPKDVGSRTHRGIGFVTFESPDSVDKIMNETHELGGSMVAVDRATPKEETLKFWGKSFPDQYSLYNAYMAAAAAAAAQFGGAFGVGAMGGYDYAGYGFPGEIGTAGTERPTGADNAWDYVDGGIDKSSSLAGAPAAIASAVGYASGGLAAHSAAGYDSRVPHGGAPITSTDADGFGSDPSHSSAPNAATGYGSSVLHNNEHFLATTGSSVASYGSGAPAGASSAGYVSSAPAGTTSAVGYASSASHSSALTSTVSAAAYGSGDSYGGAPAVPSAPGYTVSPAPTSAAGYFSNSSYSGSTAMQTYAADYGSASSYNFSSAALTSDSRYGSSASYSAPAAPNSVTGFSYVGAPAAASSGTGISYAGAPGALPSSTGYGSSTYSGTPATPTSPVGYGPSTPTMGNKIFIGRLPMEATSEHLRTYFSSFGRILDVYVPKDAKKKGHRGFGFVTFFEDGVAERVAMESHEILGQPIAVDRPTPQDSGANMPYASNFSTLSSTGGAAPWGSTPRMGYGSLPSSFDYFAGGWGSYAGGAVGPPSSGDASDGTRVSRSDARYKPY